MNLIAIANLLRKQLNTQQFSHPITHVYNPLDYARAAHGQYVTRYGSASKEVVLVGMNPGPWGMVQTGVPFGEIQLVRHWLGIEAPIRKPVSEHPKRPVLGFACRRCEVSGARLWGWARDCFQTPQHFFSRFFVVNYCPLAFFDAEGHNLTPDRLPAGERRPLEDACDLALRRTVEFLQPPLVIGIGGYAESRAGAALEGLDVTVGRILHPSPASPAANRNWAGKIEVQLRSYGVKLPAAR